MTFGRAFVVVLFAFCLFPTGEAIRDRHLVDSEDYSDEVDTPIRKTSHKGGKISINDFNYYYKTGKPPPDAQSKNWLTHLSQTETFLSSTLIIDVINVAETMDSATEDNFGNATALFLDKIFRSQDVYQVTIRAVTVVNQITSSASLEHDGMPALSVKVVVAAQFRPDGDQSLTDENFKTVLLYVIEKYKEHLVHYLQRKDNFFLIVPVENGIVAKEVPQQQTQQLQANGGQTREEQVESGESNTAAIVALSIGCTGILVLCISFIMYYRQQKRLEKLHPELETKSITAHSRTVAADDDDDTYSLSKYDLPVSRSPQVSSERQRVSSERRTPAKKSSTFRAVSFNESDLDESYDDHRNEQLLLPSKASSDRWPSSSSMEEPKKTRLSSDGEMLRTEMERSFLRRTCYAPPGKLGCSIDSIDGEPHVHRIKKGSPLDGILQSSDRIVAIDDVDTSGMSAADVTQLMVKKMNHMRRISYIRGGSAV